MGVAIYARNNELLVPGRKQEDPAAVADDPTAMLMLEEDPTAFADGAAAMLMSEEDPAAVADGAAAMLMSEQMEPSLQPSTNTRSSRSAGPPEKQPWTFGGSYWPSCK
jgi:hypothetical protein